ncbi:MAG: Maf family protein [Leptospirales bacterium]|nr:Maf family protein [Leptospirales bacterium]
MKAVLGSASPRRSELLGLIYPDFDIVVPDIKEEIRGGETSVDFAERMSREKMAAVISLYLDKETPFFAVTADTVVSIKGRSIGKPANFKDAVRILAGLSGQAHEVITGITVFMKYRHKYDIMLTAHETTKVVFKKLDDAEIIRYLNMIEYMDKAGAYAVQENGELIIERVSGSVSNVAGFPLGLFLRMLPAAILL